MRSAFSYHKWGQKTLLNETVTFYTHFARVVSSVGCPKLPSVANQTTRHLRIRDRLRHSESLRISEFASARAFAQDGHCATQFNSTLNTERNHQGIDNELIELNESTDSTEGDVTRGVIVYTSVCPGNNGGIGQSKDSDMARINSASLAVTS